MDDIVVGINKEYALSSIEKSIDSFCDAIKKKNSIINSLQVQLKIEQKRRISLAGVYAKKLGVIMNSYKFNKIYRSD